MKKLLILLLLCFLTTSAFGQFFAPQQKPMLGLQVNWAKPITKNLVCYLPFNEGSGGQVFDLSGNNNTGTLVNDTHWVAGKFGHALSFDGTDDYLDISSCVDDFNAKQGTLAGWYRWESYSNDAFEAFFSMRYDDNFECYEEAGDFYFRYGDGVNFISFPVPSLNSWHFWVFIWDNSVGAKVYKDGLEVASFSGSWVAGTPTGDFFIGELDGANGSFQGQIDHVIVRNRALSASEIALLYSQPFIFMEPSWNWVLYGGISVAPSGQIIYINQF